MKKCKILMPCGGLGAGMDEEAFENGMKMGPDCIAIDSGSTDSGPAYLANAMCKSSRAMLKHDLAIAVKGARRADIPLFIGSCGTCGTDKTVDEVAEITMEILKENGLTAKIAKVYSQQDPEYLKEKYREGKIHALEGAPEISEATFDECTNIVAVMGAEPFIKAYTEGANIILCGRATDTAIIAAFPVYMGCNEAAAWHGAKVVECGSQCADLEEGLGVFLEVDEEGFSVRPLNPKAHCTPYTVSAHLLYENVDPFCLTEPSGKILAKNAVYTQEDEFTCRVTGSEFEHSPQYTNKLEGAGIAGYQNISLVGMADPDVLANPQKWIDTITAYATKALMRSGINPDDFSLDFKAYGYNAVLAGPVPEGTPTPREIGMLCTITAKTQELAHNIGKSMQPLLLHCPADITSRKQLPSYAFPFSPVDCDRGPCYEFKLYHVIDVDDPLELMRFEYIDVV